MTVISTDPRPRGQSLGTVWWFVLLVGVAVAVVVNGVLPDDDPRLDGLYLTQLFGAALSILVAVAVRRPKRRVALGWLALGIGTTCYAMGDALWIVYARQGLEPFPSPADALFVGGTAIMIAGAVAVASSRRAIVDRAATYDTLIIAGGVGSVLWVVLVEPYASDPSLPFLDQAFAAAFPLLDVFLVATIARLTISGGRLPEGMIILLAGIVAVTAMDILYYQQEIAGTYGEWGTVDLVYMLGFAALAASSWHPSSAMLEEAREQPIHLTPARFVTLAVFACTPLITIAWVVTTNHPGNLAILAVLSAVLVSLVIARTWTLVGVTKEIALLRGHMQFSTMISNSSDAIVVVAEDGIIGYVSPALNSSWGWESGSLVGEPFATLLAPASRLSAATWLHEAATANHPAHLDAEWVGSDGDARPVSMVISDLRHDADIGGFVVTGRDVSYRVELEHQMRHEAQHDTLTQLWNRSTMIRHLQDSLSQGLATGHTMLFIDLDDFKDVNDGLGHAVGDEVLIQVAQRLRDATRAKDGVARLGGDEFAILLPDTDASDAARVADLVVDALVEPMEVGGHGLSISASIGWCTPNGERDAKSVIRNADLAMYAAKRDGKARSVGFRNDLLVQAEQRLELRRGLSTAIANGEMHLVYQPLISVSDGWTTGYEALLRWTPSGLDPVAPDDFIPIAEETGAIIPIGEWVLEQACLAGMALSDTPAGDLPVISVNVSPVQLRHDFKAVVARVLTATGLPADRLQLELTESRIADSEAAVAFQELDQLGVRLALDDFGTGYCSLSYLKQFHLDVIKIDRSLVSDAVEDSSLLDGVARLISAVGAVALAEGVEDREQHAALGRLGVPLAQGFLYARPAPAIAAAPVLQPSAISLASMDRSIQDDIRHGRHGV